MSERPFPFCLLSPNKEGRKVSRVTKPRALAFKSTSLRRNKIYQMCVTRKEAHYYAIWGQFPLHPICTFCMHFKPVQLDCVPLMRTSSFVVIVHCKKIIPSMFFSYNFRTVFTLMDYFFIMGGWYKDCTFMPLCQANCSITI